MPSASKIKQKPIMANFLLMSQRENNIKPKTKKASSAGQGTIKKELIAIPRIKERQKYKNIREEVITEF